VVAVTDSGSLDDGSLYLAMELLDGRSLEEILEKGPLPLRRAIEIGKQILSGLEAAHALGFVHRDVKPGNVIITRSGGMDTVKLIDFGIASNDRAAIKLTVMGVAFGTPEYISPEMALGVPVDARADLYSVGVVLFEMVTGRLPFAAKDVSVLLREHVGAPPPRPSSVAPKAGVPPALEEVIHRALAKIPEERYSSAKAMREALAGVSPEQPARRRRNWKWLALPLTIGLFVAAAFSIRGRSPSKPTPPGAVQPAPSKPTAPSPAPPPARSKRHPTPSHRAR
jgi:serine/threonine-protein kinase